MNALMVNAGGLILMAAIVWWFWLSPSTSGDSGNDHSHHH